MTFPIPSIIRLKTYIPNRHSTPIRFSRENIYVRDGYTCQYCDQRFTNRDLTLDHVIPVSKGGKKDWTNIVTACMTCNQRKADRSPLEARMPLKAKPTVPQWLPQEELRISSNNAPESWKIYLQFEAG
jgi:5-methylcytosine-specific restriction endonuclease McrA